MSLHKKNKEKLSIIGIVAAVICALLGDSATGKVAVLIVLLLYCFYRIKIFDKYKAIFNLRFFIGVIIVLFFALVIFNYTGVFSSFIVKQ